VPGGLKAGKCTVVVAHATGLRFTVATV